MYHIERQNLFASLNSIHMKSEDIRLKDLLFGNEALSSIDNKKLLSFVEKFIRDTKRF